MSEGDLYVYYRVRDDAAATLLPLVAAMQAQLGAAHRVSAALKRRPGSHDGLQTWMEVYPAAPAGFTDALHTAASGFAALLAGPRHTEVFVDLKSCA